MRTYRIEKTETYTEERKALMSSYKFFYFNEKSSDWRETRNENTKYYLKQLIVENPEALNYMIKVELYK
jgi:hypothetical protein